MNDKLLLNKKTHRPKQLIFKTEKTSKEINELNEEQTNNKKAKIEEIKEIEKEFDYCQINLLNQILVLLSNFLNLIIEDYTFYCYNNLKEVKNNENFQIEVRKIIDNPSHKPFLEKVLDFIMERKEILEISEKEGMKGYKKYITERTNTPDLFKKSSQHINNYNNLSKDEQESIFISGLIKYSFDYIQKEEEKFDTSVNKDINKKNEIKIEVQNFNLKDNALYILISGFKFNNNITEIDLKGNDLTPKVCFSLGTVFKYNKRNIKVLNLSRCSLDNKCLNMFIIGSTHSSEILNKEPIYLDKLILKENDKINSEDIFGEYPLSLIMKRFIIKNLNLMNTKIGNSGLKKLCKTFLELLNNNDDNKFMLENLNLYNIGLKNEDSLELLGDVLAHGKSNLQTLILNKNSISCYPTPIQGSTPNPNYFKYLMEKVGNSKTLKELLLLKCEIGKNKNDIEILCKMLETNKNLESLRMFDNLINDEDDFLKILQLFSEHNNDELKNKTLKSLDLSKNHCNIRITEDFLNMIDKLNLEYLDINQNQMDEKEKEIFRNRTNNLEKIKIIY